MVDETYTPPEAVAANARKGLKLREKFNRGGTEVGYERAQQLSERQALSVGTLKKMYAYFRRHSVDKKASQFGDEENPSKGYIAWLLWGGDEAYSWVREVLDK